MLLHRPGAAWPVLLGANRDEMLARPWLAPASHWPELPGVIGGLDTLAGGTWLAHSAHGVVAGILNRSGSLGPQEGKRSRGELPLMALRHTSAAQAAADAAGWDAGAWRSFNLVVADASDAYCIRGLGEGRAQVVRLQPGLAMVTAADPNDTTHPRIARHLPAFQQAEPPDPPDWKAWPALLADSSGPWDQALNVPPLQGFGTASAALIAIQPGRGEQGRREHLFTRGAPGGAPWEAADA